MRTLQITLLALVVAAAATVAVRSSSSPEAVDLASPEERDPSPPAAGEALLAGGAGRGPRGRIAPRQAPRVAVRGVVLRDGRLVAGAEVALWPCAPASSRRDRAAIAAAAHPLGTTRSGVDGRFAFEAVEFAPYRLVARDGDGACDDRVGLWWGGEDVRLDLTAATPLRGHLFGPDGAPFPATAVVVQVRDLRGDPAPTFDGAGGLPTCPVDAEGGFEFGGLPAGHAVWVRFVAVGGEEAVLARVELPHAGDWVVRVPPAHPVVGVVVDATTGSGVAGAEVFASWGDEDGGTSSTRTDRDGRFEATVRSTAGVALVARAPGFVDASEAVVGQARVELALARLVRVDGRVTGPGGEAVGGVVVQARAEERRSPLGERAALDADVDASGRFELLVEPETPWRLSVLGGGFLATEWVVAGGAPRPAFEPLELDAPAPTPKAGPLETLLHPDRGDVVDAAAVRRLGADGSPVAVEVRVRRGRTLAGRVARADGTPVVGAFVAVRRVGFEPGGAPDVWMQDATGVEVDRDGHFELLGLPSARAFELTAQMWGMREATATVAVGADGTCPATSLVLEPSIVARRTVTVVDARTDAPIRGATVGDGRTGQTTASDGRVEIRAAPAPRPCSVAADGYLAAVTVVADADVVVRLERGVEVGGRLVAEDGAPIVGARMAFVSAAGDLATAQPAADGRFQFAAAHAGTGRLTVHPLGGGDAVVDRAVDPATPIGEVRVLAADLAAAHAHLVRVRGEGGAAVERVVFGVGPSDATEDVAGAIAIVGAGAPWGGAPAVDVRSATRASDHARLAARVVPLAGAPTVLEIVLPEQRAVHGRVVGPDGVDLAVALDVVSANALGAPAAAPDVATTQQLRRGSWKARADRDGRFVLWNVPADGCIVAARADDARFVADPVRIRPGDRDVVLALRAAVRPRIRVVDAESRPVAEAFVGAFVDGSSIWRQGSRTDAAGEVTLGALDAATPLVLVVDAAERGLLQVRRTDWRPRDEVVVLEAGGSVSGVVVDPDGKTIPAVGVWYRQGGAWTWVWADEAGRFRVEGLAPGTVELASDHSAPADDDSASAPVEVAVGRTDVRLTTIVGDELTVHLEGFDGLPEEAYFLVDDDPARRIAAMHVDDATLRLRRCDRKRTYALWVPPDAEGRLAWASGLHAPGDVRVARRLGGTLVVWVRDAEGAAVSVAAVRGVIEREGTRRADGAFVVVGLPDGPMTVRVTARVGDAMNVRTERTASAGETVDVSLAEARAR